MTVSIQNPYIEYGANGVTTVFPYPFRILAATDLKVFFNSVGQSTGFTVTGVDNNNGGNVTFGVAPGAGVRVSLIRVTPRDQQVDYLAYDSFPAETHERALDKLTLEVQENTGLFFSAIRASIPDLAEGSNLVLPNAATRASKYLGFDANGNVVVLFNSSGITDHGTLTGLTDDDHLQYFNLGRGDTRYLRPNKNAIINGDMEIAQRGTSFAAVINGQYTLDRWRRRVAGTMVHTITQDIDVPTVAQAGRLYTHSMKFTLTTPSPAIAAGDFCGTSQSVEGYNWRALAQRFVTVSFWFKSPITGIHCAALQNSDEQRSCVKEFTVLVAGAWEQKILTFPASPSAGAWDYTNGVGVRLSIMFACGSTFQTVPDVYQTGQFFATANQVNGVNAGITPYFITGVEFEPGTVATGFEPRMIQEELALCRRYLPAYIPESGGRLSIASGFAAASTQGIFVIPFGVPARVSPTGATTANAAGFEVLNGSGAAIASTSLVFNNASQTAGEIAMNVAAGLTAGQGSALRSLSINANLLFTGCEL